MLCMSQARESHRIPSWARVNRPIQPLDNPVKRYLGNRSVGPGLWRRPSRWRHRRKIYLRPAL